MIRGFKGWSSIAVRHPLGSIFLAAIIVRFLNIAHIAATDGAFVIEDSFFLTYSTEWARAFGLMEGSPASNNYAERVPFYPLVVAFLQRVGLGAPAMLAFVNALFDSLTCVIVGLMGCRLERRLGIAAGFLAALWPNLIVHSGIVLNDALFVLLISNLLYWSVKYLENPTGRSAVLAGIFLGFAIITRPVAQFLVPEIVIAAAGIALFHGASKRRAAGLACVLLLPVIVLVAPVLAHNNAKFGSLALSAQSGTHLAYWVIPPIKKADTGAPFEETIARIRSAYSAQLKTSGIVSAELSLFEESARLSSIAMTEFFASSPISIAKAWLKGMVENMASPAILIDPRVRARATQSFYALEAPNFGVKVWRYVSGNGPVYMALFVIGALGSIATLCLAAYGYLLLWRRNCWAAVFAGLAVLYFLLVNGPVASPKYRLPFEPIMVILTALGGLGVWDWWRARSETEPGVS